jgi:hypothetical protein
MLKAAAPPAIKAVPISVCKSAPIGIDPCNPEQNPATVVNKTRAVNFGFVSLKRSAVWLQTPRCLKTDPAPGLVVMNPLPAEMPQLYEIRHAPSMRIASASSSSQQSTI